MLGSFLWLTNQCENQHPKARRYGTTKPLFFKVDFGEADQVKVDLGKLRKEMYEFAGKASLDEMLPHADYLNIPFIHMETGEEREYDAIREDYKQIALDNPKMFSDTVNSPKIKMLFIIKNLQNAGKIGINTIQNGQAHWMDTKKLICVLPPDRSPIEYLSEFALTTEGDLFSKQVIQFKTFQNIQL